MAASCFPYALFNSIARMDKKCLLLVSKKLDLRKTNKYYTQCLFTRVAQL